MKKVKQKMPSAMAIIHHMNSDFNLRNKLKNKCGINIACEYRKI